MIAPYVIRQILLILHAFTADESFASDLLSLPIRLGGILLRDSLLGGLLHNEDEAILDYDAFVFERT